VPVLENPVEAMLAHHQRHLHPLAVIDAHAIDFPEEAGNNPVKAMPHHKKQGRRVGSHHQSGT